MAITGRTSNASGSDPACLQGWYPPLRQLHSHFRDLKNGVDHFRKITIAESNPDMGLFTQRTFLFIHIVLVRDNKLPVMTLEIASSRDQVFTYHLCRKQKVSYLVRGVQSFTLKILSFIKCQNRSFVSS